MPQPDRRESSWWSVLDERSAVGGHAKGLVFLTHPGPSVLVTAVEVAAAGLLTRRVPSFGVAAGLTLVMLPAQLAIGALNDWVDVASDRFSKPFKPIARGVVRRGAALAIALCGCAVSLGTAAWLGPAALGVAVLGLGAGLGYDLALKRSPAAILAWWAGFTAVPLLAMVVTGRLRGAPAGVGLAGLLALALLLANGLPDIEGDRRTGARTLAGLLGPAGARWAAGLALAVAALGIVAARSALGQSGLALIAAGLLAAAALVPALSGGASRLVFPLLAACVAGATVSWLAALPQTAPV